MSDMIWVMCTVCGTEIGTTHDNWHDRSDIYCDTCNQDHPYEFFEEIAESEGE